MRNVNDPASLTHHVVEANGITIHYVEEGNRPLVILQPLYDGMDRLYPSLVAKHLLDGVGHGAPEEAPHQVSSLLIDFLTHQATRR